MEKTSPLEYTRESGGYFMTEESKDAVVGRVMREYKENEENLARLLAEANRLGGRIGQIGKGLMQRPEAVILAGGGLPVDYMNQRVDISPADFDIEKITKLTNDYRAGLEAKTKLERELGRLGFPQQRHY